MTTEQSSARHIDTVLIANRGEIAVRVARTLRTMGIRSVAVYSDADSAARHVRAADTAVRLGPAPARESYLSVDKVVDAALRAGAQAIHPGYGFLSENSAFAAECDKRGIVFIGPSAHAIDVMGDKITAKNAVAEFGVPVVPGIARPGLTDADLIAAADDIGYPVLVKPSAGGGGKGMRLVEDPALLADALVSARREAASSFGDDTLFLERFVLRPRHIEVQILADSRGNVVHLGERECSLQRRHQKVVEEAPSPLLDDATRERIGKAACDTARSVDYTGAGTVEFIVSADRPDEFFFMEMNTRLQVEHPVTELVTGLDLVQWQTRIAAGEALDFAQSDVTMTGHAIETRVYAEDPGRGFLPTGGRVLALREPSGPGVRVDSGLSVGTVVGSDYDPMLSKVIVHADDRDAALRGLDRALAQNVVLGVVTNTAFARFLLADPDVRAGHLDTGLLDRRVADYVAEPAPDHVMVAAAAALWARRWPQPGRVGQPGRTDPWDIPTGWRGAREPAPTTVRIASPTRTLHVLISGSLSDAFVVVVDSSVVDSSVVDSSVVDSSVVSSSVAREESRSTLSAELVDDTVVVTTNGYRRTYMVAESDGTVWIGTDSGTWPLKVLAETSTREDDAATGDADLLSPMPGSIIAVGAATGDLVEAGATVVVVEAMKMEHALTAPVTGVVELLTGTGDQVTVDQLLARITPEESTREGDS